MLSGVFKERISLSASGHSRKKLVHNPHSLDIRFILTILKMHVKFKTFVWIIHIYQDPFRMNSMCTIHEGSQSEGNCFFLSSDLKKKKVITLGRLARTLSWGTSGIFLSTLHFHKSLHLHTSSPFPTGLPKWRPGWILMPSVPGHPWTVKHLLMSETQKWTWLLNTNYYSGHLLELSWKK